MGNEQSTLALASLSNEDVASAVSAKGIKFEPYAVAIRENGVDGEFLEALEGDEELAEMLDELEISSKVHRKVLTLAVKKAQKQNQQSFTEEVLEEVPAYFKAAAEYDLSIVTPDDEVREFDAIAQQVLDENSNASFAAVNLILEDAQHPVGARLRQLDGTTVSHRKAAHLSVKDSVCYYLVHDPSKDFMIKELPPDNPFGASAYVGFVIKNNENARVGAVCQVADIQDQQDEEEQIALLNKLASMAQEQLEERRALQERARSLREQVENFGAGDDVVLPSYGPVKAVTASQVRSAPPNDYPSPEQVLKSGKRRDSSKLPAYRQGLATEEERAHIPQDLFDAVDEAGMPRPPIGSKDMERVAAVEKLGLHKMDPDGPVATSLKNLTATAAQLFRFPLAQISFHNHAKEFAFCPYAASLTKDQSDKLDDFVDEWLVKDSAGDPFLGSRGRGNAVCNYAILTKKTFVVHDLWEDEAFTMYRDLKFIRSYVGCPILSIEGHVIALLCMFDFKARPDFDKAHELQAENIARMIAQNIENWQLRQEIEQLERERQLLSRNASNQKSRPPKGDVTLVFTDVQGSTQLWEQDAEAMEAALKVHDAVMRKCCADTFGYEITTEGDAFHLAFHDPVDAIMFALNVQMELHWASWPERILCKPDAAVDLDSALQGLRVRIGIHSGPVTTREHEVTGRARYMGKTVRLTKSIEAMCHGGQILVSVDAWRVVSSLLETLGSPQVLDLGEHILMTGTCMSDGIVAKRVLQLVPKEVAFDYSAARKDNATAVTYITPNEEVPSDLIHGNESTVRGRQFPPVITKRQLSPSFHDAPFVDGQVTILFIFSPGLETMSEETADATLATTGKLMRSLLVETDGYECKEDRGLWMVAFPRPSQAAQFALSFMNAIAASPSLDESVDRGSLIKAGIHSGTFQSMGPHPTTGRADYYGPVVNRAARVAAAGNAGEVILGILEPPSSAPEELVTPPVLDPSIRMTCLGTKPLKGVSQQIALFSCCQE